MALLRCDECGSSDTNAFGSWDAQITILCKKCSDKRREVALLPCGEKECKNPHEKTYRGCGSCKYKI